MLFLLIFGMFFLLVFTKQVQARSRKVLIGFFRKSFVFQEAFCHLRRLCIGHSADFLHSPGCQKCKCYHFQEHFCTNEARAAGRRPASHAQLVILSITTSFMRDFVSATQDERK